MATHEEDMKDETMTTAEAGKLGGDEILERKGTDFYSEIGSQQGADTNPGNFKNRSKEDVQEAGRRGGLSRGDQSSADELDEAA